jgi:branched-chain amino acid transport system substrate-binding protein
MMGILVGQNLNTFYDVRASSDLDVPVGTTTTLTQAYEHIRYDPPAVKDVYAATNFMEELGANDERAGQFVESYHDSFPDAEYMNENAQNNYWSVYLYKQAVEEAGTTDQEAVIDVIEQGLDISVPEGDLSMHGPTHHTSHNIAVAHATEDHEIEFISRDIVEPQYLQSVGCDLTQQEDSTLYIPGQENQ